VDTRLIILAVTFALVVVSIIVLIVALVRSRRPLPAEGMVAQPGEWPMLNAAPADAPNPAEDSPFVVPKSGMAAVLSQPLRTGTWRPDTPDISPSPVASAGDYWDSLIDAPELLLREPAAQDMTPTAVSIPTPAIPSPAPAAPPTVEVTPEPAPAMPSPMPTTPPVVAVKQEPESVAAPTFQVTSEPALKIVVPPVAPAAAPPAPPAAAAATDDEGWLVDLVAELDAPEPLTTSVEPEIAEAHGASEPEVAVEPSPPISLEPAEPAISSTPVPPMVVEFEPALEAVSEPEPSVLPPIVSQAPRPAATVPVAPIPPALEPRPQVAAVARPDEPRPQVVMHVESTPPAAPAERVAFTEPSARESAGAEFELVAPVEMWFGDARVGVKPGSKTYDRFQRIAKVLFDDLQQAKSGI